MIFKIGKKAIEYKNGQFVLSKKYVDNMTNEEKDKAINSVKEKINNMDPVSSSTGSVRKCNNLTVFTSVLMNLKRNTSAPKTYQIYLDDDALYIFSLKFKNENHILKDIKKILFVCKYEYDEDTRNAMLDLFQKSTIRVSASINNYGEVLCHPIILEILIRCMSLEKREIPIYNVFSKTFPNGKVRELAEPHPEIMGLLKELNKTLQQTYGNENDGIQIAYKKGKNIVDNAIPHKDNRYVFKGDIENFFPSCKRDLVKKYIWYLFQYSVNGDQLMDRFLDYMLIEDALCLGNPISATLANAIVAKPAEYMYNMFNKSDMAFTQYSDDITVSSYRPISKEYVVEVFNKAYSTYDLSDKFKLKESKLKGQVGQYRNVCGIAFDHTNDNAPTVRGYLYRTLRVAIHKLSLGQNVDLDVVRGQINFMVMVGQKDKIVKYINKFPGLDEQYHLIPKETQTSEETPF